HHYRWGWKEKNKAGKSLVAPDIEHQYNLPQGQSYDLQGEGLIINNGSTGTDASDASPFGTNPLDTLNRNALGKTQGTKK
ncbi:MAG: hypothetical protein KAT61_10670, partial [Gammaproteobacteria bacterium]|nr:hypothetical protein [Gammaproteobacteria bacterium]